MSATVPLVALHLGEADTVARVLVVLEDWLIDVSDDVRDNIRDNIRDNQDDAAFREFLRDLGTAGVAVTAVRSRSFPAGRLA